MLEITGPIPIPGLPGQTIDSTNAVEFLTFGQNTAYPDDAAADDGITQLVDDLFSAFVEAQLPSPEDIGSLFGPLAHDRRLRLVSMDPDDRALLERMSLSVDVPVGDGHDLLGIISRNANPSKIDVFLRRESTYTVDWDPESGEVDGLVEVTLHNDAPSEGLPPIVIGNAGALFPAPTSRHWAW